MEKDGASNKYLPATVDSIRARNNPIVIAIGLGSGVIED